MNWSKVRKLIPFLGIVVLYVLVILLTYTRKPVKKENPVTPEDGVTNYTGINQFYMDSLLRKNAK